MATVNAHIHTPTISHRTRVVHPCIVLGLRTLLTNLQQPVQRIVRRQQSLMPVLHECISLRKYPTLTSRGRVIDHQAVLSREVSVLGFRLFQERFR